jgi:hypothetical protein
VVCDYVVDELHRKFREKFPDKMVELDAGADLFLTGDKDFLESKITDPRIISVSEFLER